jgi:hypothetical protein
MAVPAAVTVGMNRAIPRSKASSSISIVCVIFVGTPTSCPVSANSRTRHGGREACPAVSSTQPANALHVLLCAIHTVSRFHSVALEAQVQLSGLPRVFVHVLAFSSTPSHADAAEFSSTPSHAAAAARALCSFHHSPRVLQLSDSRCSTAQRGRTAPGRHGHQTTTS